jgi:hypothetical protein
MFGVCGICVLIVGTKAIKAKVKVAITPILPARLTSWKNTNKFIKPIIQRGMKIFIKLLPGCL